MIISGAAVKVDVVDVCVVVVESNLLLDVSQGRLRCGVVLKRSSCCSCSLCMVISQSFHENIGDNIRSVTVSVIGVVVVVDSVVDVVVVRGVVVEVVVVNSSVTG